MSRALLFACLLLSACKNAEVVESSYQDLKAARADSLFKRGWVPDILPASVESINCRNNLDRNTSEGSFKIGKDDVSEFASKLRECKKSAIDIEEFSRLGELGFRPQCYQVNETYWIFYLNWESGECAFTVFSMGMICRSR